MNTIELSTWQEFFTRLGIGLCVVAGLAFVAHSFCKSSSWRRSIWQIALTCSLLIAVIEMSGAAKGFGIWLFGKEAPQRVISVKVFDPEPELVSSYAETRATPSVPLSAVAFELPKNCWWPAMLWISGGAIVLGRILFAQGVFIVFRSKQKRLTNAGLLTEIKLLSGQLNLRRTVRVYELQQVSGPIAFGIARPSIGVPKGFDEQFTPAQQQAMLAHELAHLRSHDPLWYLIANIVTAVFWWHPGIWWMRRQLHAASEFAADEAVVLLENGPVTLAECLVTFGRQLTASRPMNALGMGGFHSNLGKRVEALLNLKASPFQSGKAWQQTVAKVTAPICLIALLICTVGWFENREAQRVSDFSSTVQGSWGNSLAALTFAAAREEHELRKLFAQVEPESPQVASSPSVQEVFRKLEEIRFPIFEMQNVTLHEAVKFLNAETIRLDPDHKGVRFTTTVTNTVRINLVEPVRNFALQNVIRAIAVVADKPITYLVDAKGVVTFKEHQAPQAARYSERFTIDLARFENELVANGFEIDKRRYEPDDNENPVKVWRTLPSLTNYFISKGIKISSGTVIQISPEASQLRVSGVLEDVVAVETAVRSFRVVDTVAVTTNAPQPLITSIFKVDAQALLARVSAAGITPEPGVSFNAPRVIGDFPNIKRGTDLRGVPNSWGAPSLSSSGLNFVTKTNTMRSNNDLVRKYFSKEGIELEPPKSVFLNDRSGELIVRASYEETKAIGKLLGSLPLENRGDTFEVTNICSFIVNWAVLLQAAEVHFSELGQPNTFSVVRDYFRTKGISSAALQSLEVTDSGNLFISRATRADIKKIEAFPGIKSLPIPNIKTNSGLISNASDDVRMSQRIHASTLVQEGKVLFETGKLDEAEKRLKAVLAVDPENKEAKYYLKLIDDTDLAKELRIRASKADDRLIHPTNPPKGAIQGRKKLSSNEAIPSAPPTRRVTTSTEILELDDATGKKLGFDWFIG